MEINYEQTVARLRDIESELARLDTRATDPAVGLTDEERSYWDDLVKESKELATHKAALKRASDRAAVEAANGGKPADGVRSDLVVERGTSGPAFVIDKGNPWDLSDMRSGLSPAEQASEFRSHALRAIEKMPVTDDKRREVMTNLVERHDNRHGEIARLAVATSSPEYVRAFGKIIAAQGQLSSLSGDEQKAVARAMSLTPSAGGYLIPFQLDPNVVNTADGSFNQVRAAARTVTATGNAWHGVSSAGVTSSWDTEAQEVSDDSATFGQPTINIYKLQVFVPISVEALEDEQNVAQEIAMQIAFEKDVRESIAFVTGGGDASNQPTGIITRLSGVSGSKVSTGTADTFVVADLYKLDEQLPARFRNRASFLGHRAIYNDVRKFDTAGGASLWVQLGDGLPSRLLDKPVFEAEAMASTPSGTNNLFLVFGDFSNYVIADRIGTTVEFVPQLFGSNGRPTGQRGWFAYSRVGADTVNSGAFRVLNGN